MPTHDRWNPNTLRDLAITLGALALLLWWEASGWDLEIAARYGSDAGFALRDAWFTRDLLHHGGRWLSGVVLAVVVLHAWHGFGSATPRNHRFRWLTLVVIALVAVPALKQASATSCPWDLEMFGGRFDYVPHWMFTRVDGGPGHCFPSGHAVAAFAFLPLYFQWRGRHPRFALALLAAVLGFGLLFGWAQLARGAHFPSHTMWSAWLCWVVGAVGARWLEPQPAERLDRERDAAPADADSAEPGLPPAAASASSQLSNARTAGRRRAAASTTNP
jgi:membrane-associated PAP2 superfamily phosphatase